MIAVPLIRENVEWIVVEQPIAVSPDLMRAMKELTYGGSSDSRITKNVRPQVSLGDRDVFKINPLLDAEVFV